MHDASRKRPSSILSFHLNGDLAAGNKRAIDDNSNSTTIFGDVMHDARRARRY
jgi:hypothetical protein